jgi:hypothetical protein
MKSQVRLSNYLASKELKKRFHMKSQLRLSNWFGFQRVKKTFRIL